MNDHYTHTPVLKDAVISNLNIKPNGIYIDGTFGRGGHAKLILSCLGPEGRLLVIDKDPEALRVAKQLQQQDARVEVIDGCFSAVETYVTERDLNQKIDGILIDIGVSSPQLDDPTRGFSFQKEGPLDMRMSQNGLSAKEWIQNASEGELFKVIRQYGEEPFAKQIVKNIVKNRSLQPIASTLQLATIVSNSIPEKAKFMRKKHVATKTFQAIRMHINKELEALESFLTSAPGLLAPKGRVAVITFHSLEDKMVKANFQGLTQVKIPKNIPIRESDIKVPFAWVLKKAIASDEELTENIRARSAKVRIIEKQPLNQGSVYGSSTKSYIV